MNLVKAVAVAHDCGLEASQQFWDMKILDLRAIIGDGGCGPGKVGDVLVPDTVYGLSLKPACAIHDFDYSRAKTKLDKESADLRLLNNSIRLILTQTKSKILRWLRLRRTYKYFDAVLFAGGRFTGGKNDES